MDDSGNYSSYPFYTQMTVGNLKESIRLKVGIPVEEQQLYFERRLFPPRTSIIILGTESRYSGCGAYTKRVHGLVFWCKNYSFNIH